jgi:hypothetical protein
MSRYWRQWLPHRVAARAVFGNQVLAEFRRARRRTFGTQTRRASRDAQTVTPGRPSKPSKSRSVKAASSKRPAPPRPAKPPRPKAPASRPPAQPKQHTDLVKLSCPWCRNTGDRPEYTGTGRIKTITKVGRCNHKPKPGSGPPPGPRDVFVCVGCKNEKRAAAKCKTCKGWAVKHARAFR